MKINHPTDGTWFIADENGFLHYGYIAEGNCMVTGLDNVETYPTRAAWKAHLLQHDIDPDAVEEEPEEPEGDPFA